MKIAFVGKGGSGKSTASALFSLLLQRETRLVIDGDLNVHLPELLGVELPPTKYLSDKSNSLEIRRRLIGSNKHIVDVSKFRKTTPPGVGSVLIDINKLDDGPLADFYAQRNSLHLAVVGTYSDGEIGTSCYHNNLSILENILSHTTDEGYVIVDMVAGTDAFSNTLHAQFDMLVLLVEPTLRSIDVFNSYLELARAANVDDRLFVLGNKITDIGDEDFIRQHVPGGNYLGGIHHSAHLQSVDKGLEVLDIKKLEGSSRQSLEVVKKKLDEISVAQDERLPLLWNLHEKYSSEAHVIRSAGDIRNQIDRTFRYVK